MSILLSVQEISKSYGTQTLFQNLSFTLSEGERVGLIGPNGAGKSTLLRILAGQSQVDRGEVAPRRGLKVGYLEQVPSFPKDATVESVVQNFEGSNQDWEFHGTVQEYLSKLSLDGSRGVFPHTPVAQLSGGWKKRVALARELAKRPDLLLLDEPTNHLDVESILWLEQSIARASFAILCITHDRLFLQRISNRILEIDRRLPEGILSISGSYADYLEAKEELLLAQEQRQAAMKNTLRQETEWLRRGPKARGTKQQARIQRAQALSEELNKVQDRARNREMDLQFSSEERSPKKLIEVKNISKVVGGKTLFSDLSLTLAPKSCLGLLGENGCGKSTLLRVLLGQESPDSGSIQRASALSFAFFEQNRESLDPQLSLLKTLCPTGDHVHYREQAIHVRSYLDRFLFNPAQMEMPVGRLSGGEQSRLRLAQLMLQPANILVLDEPTNDLDIATLDLLRDCLKDFPGAVLLVTHDRFFLHEVATQILAFGPGHSSEAGKITSFASLDQWETWHNALEPIKPSEKKSLPNPEKSKIKKKLSYLEQREFDGMEAKIETLEKQLQDLHQESQSQEVCSHAQRLLEITGKIYDLEKQIEACYARWAQLEAQQA